MRATLAGAAAMRCKHDGVSSFYRAIQLAMCSRIAVDWLEIHPYFYGVYYGDSPKRLLALVL